MFMTGFRAWRGETRGDSDERRPAPAFDRPAERANVSDIEAKLDRLFSELEELRQEIRR